MPFLIEADEAARRIADGLEKGKPEIVFPLPMMLADEGRPARPRPPVVGRLEARAATRRGLAIEARSGG